MKKITHQVQVLRACTLWYGPCDWRSWWVHWWGYIEWVVIFCVYLRILSILTRASCGWSKGRVWPATTSGPFCMPPGVYPLVPATSDFDENLQSFRLTRSSRQHRPNTAVLPVDRVLRPVHLTPRFGSREGSEEFYLNRYIDLELFECLS